MRSYHSLCLQTHPDLSYSERAFSSLETTKEREGVLPWRYFSEPYNLGNLPGFSIKQIQVRNLAPPLPCRDLDQVELSPLTISFLICEKR